MVLITIQTIQETAHKFLGSSPKLGRPPNGAAFLRPFFGCLRLATLAIQECVPLPCAPLNPRYSMHGNQSDGQGMQAAADQNSSNTHRNQCMCAACTHRCMMTELHTRGAVWNFVQGPQYNVQWHIVHNAHNPQAIQEGVKSRKPSGRYCNNFEETSKQCEHNERSTACSMKRAYLCSPGTATLKATFAAFASQWATNALVEAQAQRSVPYTAPTTSSPL